jgi:hypothetical protein
LRRRAWFAYGAPIPTPEPGKLRREMEMRVQPMPEPSQWATAASRAGHLFGLAPGPYLTPQAVAQLAENVKLAIRERFDAVQALVPALEEAYARVGADPAADRLTTARIAAQLTQQLRQLDGVDLVRRLAAAEVPNETALGQSLASATAVTSGLDAFRWDRLQPLQEAQSGEGSRAESAAQVLERLRRNLESDEMVVAIQSALRQADDDLFAWLAPPPPPIPTPPPKPRLPSAYGRRTLQADEPADVLLGELRDFRANHAGEEIIVEWRVE